MELNRLSIVHLNFKGITTSDEVLVIFCLALAFLVAISASRMVLNRCPKYFAASFCFFFISTAADILKPVNPSILKIIESTSLVFSALPLLFVAHWLRKAVD
ncbi:MAG: hypothetical protein K6T91_01080 [Firmicutes bacterium]|nr:hypothetical protein [Bacillota bacterium]